MSSVEQKGALLSIHAEKEIVLSQLLEQYNVSERGIVILVNGTITKNLSMSIKPSDKILILPAITGGCF